LNVTINVCVSIINLGPCTGIIDDNDKGSIWVEPVARSA